MNEIKCPNCGAGITGEGSFCQYCGARLPDNTQRIEVGGTINHNLNWTNQAKIARIEKAAERERWERENYDKIQRKKRKDEIEAWIGMIVFLVLFGYFIIRLSGR